MLEMKITQLDTPSLYGKTIYGKNGYPDLSNNNLVLENLPVKVVFTTYRNISNESYYFEGENISSDTGKFNKIELKWNPVKDAIGYCILKGNSDKELIASGYTKDTFYYFHEKDLGKNLFFKICPLFLKAGE